MKMKKIKEPKIVLNAYKSFPELQELSENEKKKKKLMAKY